MIPNSPHSLAQQILALEAALAQGRLAQALAQADPTALGEPLDQIYHGLLHHPPGRPEARAPWVAKALAAYPLPPTRRALEPTDFELAVRARAWGLDGGAPVERAAQRAAYTRLCLDVRGISTIAQAITEPPCFSSAPLGDALERLMRDALALRWPTRFAPLLEDALEQTDLRVRLPKMSKRGVRVQVAATLPGPQHDGKAARARRAGVVLLSPGTMAEEAARSGAQRRFPPGGPVVWARILRDQLTGVIKRPVAWAGGPASGLPQTTLELIWAVVLRGAPSARGPKRRRRPGPLGQRGAL